MSTTETLVEFIFRPRSERNYGESIPLPTMSDEDREKLMGYLKRRGFDMRRYKQECRNSEKYFGIQE